MLPLQGPGSIPVQETKILQCMAKKSTPAPNGTGTRTSVGSSPPQVQVTKWWALPREYKNKDNQNFGYKICQSWGSYPETLSSKFLAASQIPPLGHKPLNYDLLFSQFLVQPLQSVVCGPLLILKTIPEALSRLLS